MHSGAGGKILLILLGGFGFAKPSHGTEKVYDLEVRQESVTKAGFTLKEALTINGQSPAPTLRFNLGDTAVIRVTNHTDEETTLHWHGVLVPWNMDGPSPTNTPAIKPGETFEYRFPIKQTGTYWYHSHTKLQEQRGLHGAIVINDAKKAALANKEDVLVLSDWTSENPSDIVANLKKDGDYYAYKKDTVASWLGAYRHGSVWDYIKGQWTRMGAMDLSDVGYDAFLVNGDKESHFEKPLAAGDVVRLRLINAASSTYFYVNIGNLRPFQVVAKDGMEVEPVSVTEILMGSGETYDILFKMPSDGGYELRSTAEDVTGFSSYLLGRGPPERVPDKIRPNIYKMNMDHGSHGAHVHGSSGHEGHEGHADHEGHSGHDSHVDHSEHAGHSEPGEPGEPGDGPEIPTSIRLDYSMLRARQDTSYLPSLHRHHTELVLDGDMRRFTWTINGKSFSEDPYLEVNTGDVVQFKIINKTMMHHPMHLHGHFFRLLNGQDERSPLIHTVDVAPMRSEEIEFYANEPGIWFFHCHNLYHMDLGMARLIRYRGFSPAPAPGHEGMDHGGMNHGGMNHDVSMVHEDRSPFYKGHVGLLSNRAEMSVGVNAGNYEVTLDLQLDNYDPKTFRSDLMFKDYLSKYLAVVGGAEFYENRFAGIAGLQYELPLQMDTTVYFTTRGQAVIRIRKDIPLTSRLDLIPTGELRFGINGRPEYELEAPLMYRLSTHWSTGVFYKWSTEIGHSVGAGFRVSF